MTMPWPSAPAPLAEDGEKVKEELDKLEKTWAYTFETMKCLLLSVPQKLRKSPYVINVMRILNFIKQHHVSLFEACVKRRAIFFRKPMSDASTQTMLSFVNAPADQTVASAQSI